MVCHQITHGRCLLQPATNNPCVTNTSAASLPGEGFSLALQPPATISPIVKTESVGDHQKNINFFVKSDAWLITTIHSAMGQVIAEVAKGNANILVIEVNQEQVEVLPNLAG